MLPTVHFVHCATATFSGKTTATYVARLSQKRTGAQQTLTRDTLYSAALARENRVRVN